MTTDNPQMDHLIGRMDSDEVPYKTGHRTERVTMTEAVLLEFADADALRQHLDDLNENGEHPVAVGWTAQPYPVPFLITLVGCYADGEDVLFDSPWQSDIQWTNGSTRCEECHGHAHGIGDLRYPVTVMATDA